jgi:hypothetical protein
LTSSSLFSRFTDIKILFSIGCVWYAPHFEPRLDAAMNLDPSPNPTLVRKSAAVRFFLRLAKNDTNFPATRFALDFSSRAARSWLGAVLLTLAACGRSRGSTSLIYDAGGDAFVSTARSEEPPVQPAGAWASADLYDISLDAVKYCVKLPADRDAGDAGADSVWVGANVRIKAKTEELFVAPSHAHLQDGGILFNPYVGAPIEGCAPPLRAIALRRGQVASGFLTFELPSRRNNLVLSFRPARWGGAGAVRIALGDIPDPH